MTTKKTATTKAGAQAGVKKAPAKKMAKSIGKSAAPAASSAGNRPVAEGTIRIRMYNVGFGDCFLVSLPGQPRERRILVDCGSVAAGANKMSDVVAKVIEDVSDNGTASIDVVIATHRHKDHVSGFANAAWRKVEVGEVWMPWTEDPADPQGKEIRDSQTKLAVALRARFAQFRENPALSSLSMERIETLDVLMLNALSNEAAMDMLHSGFSGAKTLRFLPQKDAPLSFTTSVLPGVTISVLGPSRDPAVIRDMDPPSGKSYLQMADGLSGDSVPEPFRPSWNIPEQDYARLFPSYPPPNLSSGDKGKLQKLGSDMELTVAASLDKAVNGTSLMLVLRIGSTHLLFPGDAQWGTWQAALQDSEKRALIKKASFYKIGHHGSHNATPREYVETVMGPQMLAMVSTRPGTYSNVPRGPLLDALDQHHTHVARSDKLSEAPKDFQVEGDFWADLEIPIT